MIRRQFVLVLTALLIAMSNPAAAGAGPASKTKTGGFDLTRAQERQLYLHLMRQSASEAAPPGFTAKIGATAPSSIKLNQLPASAVKLVPSAQRYSYALLYYFGMAGDVILIVEPRSRAIIDVISPLTGAW